MAGRVMVSGVWRPLADIDALLVARTYHRDADGRFGSGGGSLADLHTEAGVHATFDYHDPDTGLSAKVIHVSGGDPGRSTYVDIEVRDRAGNVVGKGTRTIHAESLRSVSHTQFALEPGVQGQGFMARYNQQVEQSYRDHGIERIEIHAEGGIAGFGPNRGMQMVGGYAWARAGYDFTPEARQTVAFAVSTHHAGPDSRYSPEVKAEIQKIAANPKASPLDYAMIGHTPGATTWPGKEIMLGTSWDGVKRL